jgi:hypothetical protein
LAIALAIEAFRLLKKIKIVIDKASNGYVLQAKSEKLYIAIT